MDQLFLVSRVQIALFSVFKNDDGGDDDNDARLALATDILRLNEASELVDRCAIFEDDGSIAFDLGELLSFLNRRTDSHPFPWLRFDMAPCCSFRLGNRRHRASHARSHLGPCVHRMARRIPRFTHDRQVPNLTSSPFVTEPVKLFFLQSDPCSPLLILLHPTLRSLCLRILSQLHQLSTFLSTLDRPILQPENKVLPASNTRDPMATVVAREQIRDIPLRQGVDVEQWGRALESCKISSVSASVQHTHIRRRLTFDFCSHHVTCT